MSALLAEVERLRAELEDERGSHAMTFSSFEGYIEDSQQQYANLCYDVVTARAKVDQLTAALAEQIEATRMVEDLRMGEIGELQRTIRSLGGDLDD